VTGPEPAVGSRLVASSLILSLILAGSLYWGLAAGSAGGGFGAVIKTLGSAADDTNMLKSIIWQIRLPRVLLAALVGATLSLGGLVFQALLRNPLAEPYILGISGGSAIGAIIGILLGLARFPGVWLTAFGGSLATLAVLLLMAAGRNLLEGNTLLLSGVMVNAFCAAVIMFLVSMAQDSRLHTIIFWLMGDLGSVTLRQVGILAATLLPCFGVIHLMTHRMNLISLGRDMARSMGVNIERTSLLLLVITSLMVSATVSHCGLVGFVGLVIPHLLRLVLGPDHRILAPASVLGGGSFMVVCDVLARTLPEQGEIPAGVITALIGAPAFIYLLRRSQR
jgi:iron complex transport system permease protein